MPVSAARKRYMAAKSGPRSSTAPVSPRYSVACRLAATGALLAIGTVMFYWLPALPDSPAYGDAGHFWRALGHAALTEAVLLLMIRFVLKPPRSHDAPD